MPTKKAIQLIQRFVSHLNQFVRISFLTLKIRARTLRWSVSRFKKYILISLFLLILFLLTVYLFKEWNWIDSQIRSVETSILSGLLIGVATVIAGVLALVFSVSLFVIQNAADNYSPTILDRFIQDKVSIILYSFIGISSLLIFCFSVLIKSQTDYVTTIVVGSIGLLALTLCLTFWHYRRMAMMVNPLRQLRDWQKLCIGYIHTIDRNIDEAIEWFKVRQKSTPIPNLGHQEYEGFSKAGFYLFQQSIHVSLEKRLRQIYSISKRAAIKRDYEVIETGLTVVSNVLRTYLTVRRDSTIPLPTAIPLSYSVDYDSLFARSFQELQEICRIGASNGDENLIRKVVDTISSIGTQAVEIIPKGDVPRNNPIVGLSILYIIGIVEESSRHNYTDPSLSGVDGIRSIAQKALTNNVPLVFEESREPLMKIALIGLMHRKSYIVNKVMETLSIISQQVVEIDHSNAWKILENCLEDAKQITILTLPLVEETGLQGSMNVTNYLGSFYDLSRKTAISYVTRFIPPKFKGKTYEDRNAMGAFHDFVEINSTLRRFYRGLGEEIGKTESFMLFYVHEAIRENIETILSILQDNTWIYERNKLENLISWYLSFYWVAFKSHQRITKNLYLDMVDYLGWLGMISAKNRYFEIADSCIQNVTSIAEYYIQKGDGFHFEAPRIFMKNIYILAVANKPPINNKIIDLVTNELQKFQLSYESKLSSFDSSGKFLQEYKDRLLVEIDQLQDDFHNYGDERNIYRDSQGLLFKEIDDADFTAIRMIVNNICNPPGLSVPGQTNGL
jgi:hypothetical protein